MDLLFKVMLYPKLKKALSSLPCAANGTPVQTPEPESQVNSPGAKEEEAGPNEGDFTHGTNLLDVSFEKAQEEAANG